MLAPARVVPGPGRRRRPKLPLPRHRAVDRLGRLGPAHRYQPPRPRPAAHSPPHRPRTRLPPRLRHRQHLPPERTTPIWQQQDRHRCRRPHLGRPQLLPIVEPLPGQIHTPARHPAKRRRAEESLYLQARPEALRNDQPPGQRTERSNG